MAKVLQAEAYSATSIQREPFEIAKSVLELKGRDLSGPERRQLPFMILDPRFDEFQNEFAEQVFANYANSDRFWARLFRAWISDFNLTGRVSELVVERLRNNLSKLPASMRDIASRYPLISTNPDFTEAAQALLSGEMSRDDRVDLGLSSDGEVTTRLAD
jgi:hypothetical protein